MASGFCFLNNVANGAKYAQKKYKCEKVVIFDWDVHFGDGTSEILIEDESVLFISLHRYEGGKFYPGGKNGSSKNVGTGKGKGFNVNVPFDVLGMGNDEYAYVCEKLLFPIMKNLSQTLS